MPTVGYDEPFQATGHWILYPKEENRVEPSDHRWRYPFLHAKTWELLLRLRDSVLAHNERLTVLEWDDYFKAEELIETGLE